jgi:hypothetical protein
VTPPIRRLPAQREYLGMKNEGDVPPPRLRPQQDGTTPKTHAEAFGVLRLCPTALRELVAARCT